MVCSYSDAMCLLLILPVSREGVCKGRMYVSVKASVVVARSSSASLSSTNVDLARPALTTHLPWQIPLAAWAAGRHLDGELCNLAVCGRLSAHPLGVQDRDGPRRSTRSSPHRCPPRRPSTSLLRSPLLWAYLELTSGGSVLTSVSRPGPARTTGILERSAACIARARRRQRPSSTRSESLHAGNDDCDSRRTSSSICGVLAVERRDDPGLASRKSVSELRPLELRTVQVGPCLLKSASPR